MVLVTGGTGLVGSHLLFDLVKAGNKVRAIYRNEAKIGMVRKVFGYYTDNPEPFFKKIEWLKCDICDIPTLEKVFEGISQVYHCAALISFDPRDRKKLFKINVEGTANIVNLCISNTINKLCYVSSIATIGNTTDNSPANETTEFNEALGNVYALSKYHAEMEVWRGSQEGVNAIIVNPGLILGPGFWNNGSGRIFQRIYKGLKYYPPKGTGFISVNDVVKPMTLLMGSNIINRNYILVAENLLYKKVFSTIALSLHKKPPQKLLKNWMLSILWRLDWLKSLITNNERVLSKKMARSFDVNTVYNSKKVKTTLEFEFEDINDVIQFCAATFLKENP
jgi:nucleoside-diphosphate-sugar epimerase